MKQGKPNRTDHLVQITRDGDVIWPGDKRDLDSLAAAIKQFAPEKRAIPILILRLERLRQAAEKFRGNSQELDEALDQFV